MQSKIREFIDNQKWTFAKTYAKTAPHEYIVRDNLSNDNKEIFDAFDELIEENGYIKKFYDTEYKYFDIDEKKYWVIENILNRDDVKNTYE